MYIIWVNNYLYSLQKMRPTDNNAEMALKPTQHNKSKQSNKEMHNFLIMCISGQQKNLIGLYWHISLHG